MRKLSLLTLTLLGAAACFSTACSDDDDDNGTGGAGGRATGGKAAGGKAAGGKASGGTAGKASGGTAGKATGGVAPTGGVGVGGKATGGVAPTGGVGVGGKATGGTPPVGGGGVGGKATGGTPPVGGGGVGGSVGGAAPIAEWQYPASAGAGGVGGTGSVVAGWDLVNGGATATLAADAAASDGSAAQIVVTALSSTVNPEFALALPDVLDAAGHTLYVSYRVVSPADATTMEQDAVRLFVTSKHASTSNAGGAGGVSSTTLLTKMSSDPVGLASFTGTAYRTASFLIPAASTDWYPTEVGVVGLQFVVANTTENAGGAGGVSTVAGTPFNPFTVNIDKVWIQ